MRVTCGMLSDAMHIHPYVLDVLRRAGQHYVNHLDGKERDEEIFRGNLLGQQRFSFRSFCSTSCGARSHDELWEDALVVVFEDLKNGGLERVHRK